MSGFLMLGYQKSSPAHPPTPKTAACSVVALLLRLLLNCFAQKSLLRGNVPKARATQQALTNVGRRLGVAGGRRHDFWYSSMKQRRPPAASSEPSQKKHTRHNHNL